MYQAQAARVERSEIRVCFKPMLGGGSRALGCAINPPGIPRRRLDWGRTRLAATLDQTRLAK